MLRVPMQWLCTDVRRAETKTRRGIQVLVPEEERQGDGLHRRRCKDVHVNSSRTAEFDPDAVFGGATSQAPTASVSDRRVFRPRRRPRSRRELRRHVRAGERRDHQLRRSLATTGGIGNCRSAGSANPCYVGLDKSREAGWYELEDDEAPAGVRPGGGAEPPHEAPLGRRFQLPMEVCERMTTAARIGVRASTDAACEVTKTPKYPTCGPWSSVGRRRSRRRRPGGLRRRRRARHPETATMTTTRLPGRARSV